MTKSTITREQLLEIIETDHVQCGEASYLARMALAAMDSSESIELPLDYLQGHKDGLEWASQLAEANHPETGDWLYDDPIELAKAIRKGPDMPPEQPVADSEPVAIIDQANLDYLRSGADADVWPPEREEMGDVLLYRHAQPAPVVPDEVEHVAAVLELIGSFEAADIDSDTVDLRFEIDDVDTGSDASITEYAARGAAIIRMLAGNSPVIPDGYVMVPREPNGDMLAAAQDAYGETDGDIASTLRAAMLAAAPQSPGSEPTTVQGKWIPVSEQMPESEGHYLVWANASRIDGYCDHLAIATYQGGEWSNEFNWLVNHWMPLPAAPQEDINALIPLVSRNEQEVK